MGDPKKYFFKLPDAGAPSPFKIPERIYPDIRWYNRNRASDRTYHPVEGIEGVVIHATAGGSTSGALDWWKRPDGAKASAHWIVPDEDEVGHGKEVLAVVYESLAAWHVRNDKTHPLIGNRDHVNHWTLGIEIVNRQVPTDSFSDWQIEITALLVRYCWAKYPNMKYVFSHALVDPERRSDPGSQFDWDKFIALITSDVNDPPVDPQSITLMEAVSSHPSISNLNPGEDCCM
jgi:N-acetyl-anhydromuramyl-L-alanine amidase AmpD